MNNQEILPEPVSQRHEQHMSSAEVDKTYNEQADSKRAEVQPSVSTGGTAINSMNVSNAQGQVGGAVQQAAATTQQFSSSNTSGITAHLSADDLDLIEKEWVKKAKEIVQATQNDPHIQSLELSKVKADYIKKRYGKDVRVKES